MVKKLLFILLLNFSKVWQQDLIVAAVVPTIVAGLIGYAILGLRGHYFAICTLGLGVAAGEISGGIEIIGAGQGFTTPPFPNVGSLEARGEFFYFLSFISFGTYIHCC